MSFFIPMLFSLKNNPINCWLCLISCVPSKNDISLVFYFFLFLNGKIFLYIISFSRYHLGDYGGEILNEVKISRSEKNYIPLQELFIMEIITKSKNVKLRWISSGRSMYDNIDWTIGFWNYLIIVWLRRKITNMFEFLLLHFARIFYMHID